MNSYSPKRGLVRTVWRALLLCLLGFAAQPALGAPAEIPELLTPPPAQSPIPTEEINQPARQEGAPSRGAARRPLTLKGYSAWIPEWTITDALREANSQKRGLDSIEIFAVYFDKTDMPLMPEQVTRWIEDDAEGFRQNFIQELFGPQIPIYLSVVNDIFDPAGKDTSLKNPDLVSRLLKTRESREKHIQDLLALLPLGPFDGLEIDYEQVKQSDWESFLDFCAELYGELKKQDIAMRVVLEPKENYLKSALPEGPEYVVMAYNLFGFHSGPGPKANPAFIKRLGEWSGSMRVPPRFALATGGFIWDTAKKEGDSDYIRQISESEGHLLSQRERVTPKRDKESGYLVFQFPEDAKRPKIVWLADGETLAFLANSAKQNGFTNFALWCLSGNRRFSLDTWRTEVTK